MEKRHGGARVAPSEKNGKRKYIILLLLLFLLLMLLLWLWPFNGVKDALHVKAIDWDTNAEVGELTQRSEEEIQEELNRKVQEGMIRISMNTSPVFASGTAKGDLNIVNYDTNNYPQMVYIVRKDTGEEIYRSGGIAVGSKIEYAALDVDLPAGTYDCVAYFNNVDMETGDILGTAGAEITITVQS
jgi:hypothetical protein